MKVELKPIQIGILIKILERRREEASTMEQEEIYKDIIESLKSEIEGDER